MYLLDSDTSIFFLKGHPAVIAHFRKHGPKTLFLSSVSYHELRYGALHSNAVQRHLGAVQDFVAPLTVLPFTQASADYSSRVRQDLAAIGQTIGPLDMLIAGHALEHRLTLVTGNAREFSRVHGLLLETWI
ncbi:MAG: PIN domain-containing protein [Verrucomicrobiota bacterium]